MSLVFQYGSNTSEKRLNSTKRLNGAAKVVTTAYTKDFYALDFTVWSRSNGCAAADIVPDGTTKIWGVIYEIPDELIFREKKKKNKSLDAIEGESSNYKRIKIEVISSVDKLNPFPVMTYVVKKRKKGLLTSAEYANEIIKGLKSHDIPKEYMHYVYDRILINNSSLKGFLSEVN